MVQKPQSHQNAELFKLEYITKTLTNEVEFLNVTRSP